jgi:hypothetical protein
MLFQGLLREAGEMTKLDWLQTKLYASKEGAVIKLVYG